MLVLCPSCKTTYKVSDELLKGAAAVFRCSRCRHTFELGSHASAEEAVQKPPAPEEAPQQKDKAEELTFSFPAEKLENDQESGIDQKAATNFPATSRPSSVSHGPVGNVGLRSPKSPQHDLTISKPPTGIDAKQGIDPPPAVGAISQPRQPVISSQETGNVLPLAPHRDQQASVLPFLTLFFLLVISFGLLTAFHRVHPKTSEGVVKKIPLLGTSVLKNNHLKSGVDLQSLRAGYQTIQGNREVFVITGVALNTNPVVIRDVRVAGLLYNQEGAEIEQQTIWIGNAISAKIIRGMTTQDIADLQRLKPLKTFDIPPGDTVPFTIVFVKAPKGIKDFTCEVLSAEAET